MKRAVVIKRKIGEGKAIFILLVIIMILEYIRKCGIIKNTRNIIFIMLYTTIGYQISCRYIELPLKVMVVDVIIVVMCSIIGLKMMKLNASSTNKKAYTNNVPIKRYT